MTISQKIKEYKQLKELKADYVLKLEQVKRLIDKSAKAKKAVDTNGVNFRIEDRIKFYDIKIAEIKNSSLLFKIVSLFI